MINEDRKNGYNFWDKFPFSVWWDKACGRYPFPSNPKSGLNAAMDRIAAEQEFEEYKPMESETLKRSEIGYAAIRLAESFRVPEPAEPF